MIDQKLAQGTWLSFLDLPEDVTKEEIRNFFATVMPITLNDDQIAIEPMRARPGSKVTIAVNKEQWRGVLNWLLTGKKIRGRQVCTTEPRNLYDGKGQAA